MRFIGLDIGSKTIGIALSDEDGVIASPFRTLDRRSIARDVQAVIALMAERTVKSAVLGLPLDLMGAEGESARRVRAFGEALQNQVSLPVHYWDERFSTAAAERALLEGDVRRKKRKQVINHIAASLILQSFLDSPQGLALRRSKEPSE